MKRFSRRQALAIGMGLSGASVSGWFPAFAQGVTDDPRRRRHCILLWMSGGPSQTDTFDMKPNHENGGEFKEISTNVPGLKFSEHLPKLAQHADKMAVIRSLSTKEGDHGRGTHLMRTGHKPMGAIQWPAMGAALSKELGSPSEALPSYVSIAPYRAFNRQAFGPGYLGPKYAPLVVGAGRFCRGPDHPQSRVDGIPHCRGHSAVQRHVLRNDSDSQSAHRPFRTRDDDGDIYDCGFPGAGVLVVACGALAAVAGPGHRLC